MCASLFFVFIFLSGCASHDHRYVPLGGGESAQNPLTHEAFYPLNVDDGKGNLRLRSQGVVDLREKGTKVRRPALHITATLANTNGEQTWVFKPREQVAIFPDSGQSLAVPLNAEAIEVEVKPGEARTVELYFPVPGDEAAVSEFDVKWSVSVGQRAVSENTTFARAREVEEYPGFHYYDGFNWGPRYYPTVRSPMRVRR